MFGTVAVSVLSAIVIVLFRVADRDPVVHLFTWASAVAVLAIVLVEILVSVAVIAFFRRAGGEGAGGAGSLWSTLIAPALAIVGLVLGMYLLVSRFSLLAGTAAKGVDPSSRRGACRRWAGSWSRCPSSSW